MRRFQRVLNVRLRSSEYRELRAVAEREGLTLSDAARLALDHGLYRLAVLKVSDGRSDGLRQSQRVRVL